MPTTDDFRQEIRAQIDRASRQGRPHVEINAGELRRVLGNYPGGEHRMPACCDAMRHEAGQRRFETIHETESWNGAALTIRYLLD